MESVMKTIGIIGGMSCQSTAAAAGRAALGGMRDLVG
jgi:hypothetical protein